MGMDNPRSQRANQDELQQLRPRFLGQEGTGGGINWLYMTPLAAAPLLPLVRIALRPYPKARDMVFGSLIAFFLCHGAWLIGRGFNERQEQQKRLVALWDAEQRRQREEQL